MIETSEKKKSNFPQEESFGGYKGVKEKYPLCADFWFMGVLDKPSKWTEC